MSWITKWFINNPVAANLLMMAIVISGVLAFGQLRVESFPQIEPSSISITVVYPGGTAQQIDESVTQRIEESISGIAGIKQITSQSLRPFKKSLIAIGFLPCGCNSPIDKACLPQATTIPFLSLAKTWLSVSVTVV